MLHPDALAGAARDTAAVPERPPGHIATMGNRAAAHCGDLSRVTDRLERLFERNFGQGLAVPTDETAKQAEPSCSAHAEELAMLRLGYQIERLANVAQALDDRL